MIRFFVAGLPKAMSVGKSLRVPLKGGRGFQHFQRRANTDWSLLVGSIGRDYAPERPLDGALSFTAIFYVPRPATAPKKVRWPLKRPDIDNLVHKLTDHFNGVFWKDDSQIVDIVARKRFARDGRTGAAFVIAPVDPNAEEVVIRMADVGDVIEESGERFRVTEVDGDGNVVAKEPVEPEQAP